MSLPITVEAIRELGPLEAIESEWERLWSADPSAFTAHDWVVPWFRHYGLGANGRLEALVSREAREVIGIAPLYAWHGTVGGMPVRRVDFLGHNFSMPELLIARRAREVTAALVEHLVGARGPLFDVLVLRGLVLGSPQLEAVEQAVKARGFMVHQRPLPTPMIEIRGGFEDYLRARGKNLKQQLSRATKRCGAIGKITFEASTDLDALPGLLARIYALSAKSWKGPAGEAIGVQPHVAGFYREVAERFCRRGRLMISLLTLGGKDAAYVFGLTAGKRYYHIDTAYDRTLQEASPGTLVNLEVIKELHQRGFDRYINEGDEEYKARWMSGSIASIELFAFRPTVRGRISALAKLQLEPRLKELKARWDRR